MDARSRRERFELLGDEPDLARRRPRDPEQEALLPALDRARLERRRETPGAAPPTDSRPAEDEP